MPTLTQGYQTGEFILSEEAMRSRDVETVTVVSNVALPSGTVLGRITATGKMIKYVNSASDGSETAAGVLYTALPATSGDYSAVVIKREAEVINAALNAGAGVDAAGKADLLAIGIVVR